ncbi:matrixin family metalloprotease [Autumnicola musiva]|uniref:Matrixin family metalloprotease n=1 Tax=Autumnicola musiva TaxID=3075589 RepID=A0ABU3D6Z3_9FLAO|nr:matrixin family metalloprotease [Zunongwangia sp. F117]MDT0677306.1 matrixin family metalloprotease [Zunongwangia sp. F117]
MKKLLLLFFLLFGITIYGQSNGDVYYDDWPTTRPSNERIIQENDYPSLYFVPIGTTWNHRIITYFIDNGTNDIAGDNENEAIRDGFNFWSEQTSLAFLEVCDADEADIIILWATFNHGDGGPFDGPGGVLGHTLGGPPPNAFGEDAGDIHFDDSETWTLNFRNNQNDPIDLVTVAAHEIGHAIGLDHTEVPGSLMLANYTGSHRYLGSDDIAGIQSLYGTKSENIIVGPAEFCEEGTYTLDTSGIPPNSTVTWEVSPGSFFENSSGTGSTASLELDTSMSVGSIELSFTIDNGCSEVTIERTIEAATPLVALDSFCYDYYSTTCNFSLYSGTGDIEGFLLNGLGTDGSSSWEWERVFGNFKFVAYNPNFGSIGNPVNNGEGSTGRFANIEITGPGTIQFRARASNNCGWGEWKYFIVNTSSRSYTYSFAPNPATTDIIIENTSLNKLTQIHDRLSNNKEEKGSIIIYDFNGAVVQTKEYDLNSQSFNLDVSKLKPGKYFMKIGAAGKEETHQIVIRR